MTIKKTMKVLKAAERLKKYCSEHDTCKGCMFHNDNSRYIYTCMIRRTNPEEYDMNKISRGLASVGFYVENTENTDEN